MTYLRVLPISSPVTTIIPQSNSENKHFFLMSACGGPLVLIRRVWGARTTQCTYRCAAEISTPDDAVFCRQLLIGSVFTCLTFAAVVIIFFPCQRVIWGVNLCLLRTPRQVILCSAGNNRESILVADFCCCFNVFSTREVKEWRWGINVCV